MIPDQAENEKSPRNDTKGNKNKQQVRQVSKVSHVKAAYRVFEIAKEEVEDEALASAKGASERDDNTGKVADTMRAKNLLNSIFIQREGALLSLALVADDLHRLAGAWLLHSSCGHGGHNEARTALLMRE